ncbi:hypothetical protein [uncultured Muribaculum sp.]|uniref:hypothetical protein n=1 Tax=uncultured Muribaculum sp. TaxID=1918613 RepID=UPI00272D542D|nr:hypothetical protein [uncultured Muribaculum sp.]
MENQKENPAQENVAVEKKEVRKAYFPPYWEKRKKRLKKEFIQKLQDSANSEVIASDKFGEYRAGTFLHKAAIVSVQKENGMWSLHVVSEEFISSRLIEEIRYKYLPDDLLMVMAQLFGTREEAKVLKGVVLYEIPQPSKEEEK